MPVKKTTKPKPKAKSKKGGNPPLSAEECKELAAHQYRHNFKTTSKGQRKSISSSASDAKNKVKKNYPECKNHL